VGDIAIRALCWFWVAAERSEETDSTTIRQRPPILVRVGEADFEAIIAQHGFGLSSLCISGQWAMSDRYALPLARAASVVTSVELGPPETLAQYMDKTTRVGCDHAVWKTSTAAAINASSL